MSKKRGRRRKHPQKTADNNKLIKKSNRKVVGTAEKLQIEEERTNRTLRRRVAHFLLGIFALNTIGTLTVVFLVGFGLMALSNTIIISLIGETIAHAATMFFTVTKYLFPVK